MTGEQKRKPLLSHLPGGAPGGKSGHVYEIVAEPHTVHWGYFSASITPIASINPGDIVEIEDMPSLDPAALEESGVVTASEIPENHRAVYKEVKDRGPGPHIMVGPVHVNGAEPGDALEVRILNVQLAYGYGYNRQRHYAGTLPEEFTQWWQRIFRIDQAEKKVEVAHGVVVPLGRPFFGAMGVAPHQTLGRISTREPGVHGGNLDNKDLGAGSILYLPIHVKGALFSAGDGHAAQGHGEVDQTAIETGLRGRFQFFVRKDMRLKWPQAETPTHWMVMGLHRDLDEAMKIAVRETINFLGERFPRLTRQEAYMIASIAVDYHITQVVDGLKGIHGMIPKAIFAGG